MDQISFGLIGCGGISRWHLNAIKNIPAAKLGAVCDPVLKAAQAFGIEYEVPYYTEYSDMFKTEKLDAVIICTPSGLHAPIAINAMKSGLNVVVEKPLAITRESLKEVLDTEKQTGKKLAVISQLRFSDGVQRAKTLIENGALGNITMVDLSMKYYRESAYYESSNWRGTLAMDGGGALMNQGIHGLDLLNYLCPGIESVQCFSGTLLHSIEAEDTLAASYRFADGGLGVLTATTSCYPGQLRRLEICGTKGSLTITEDSLTYLETLAGDKMQADNSGGQYGASNPLAIGFELHQLQLENFVDSVTKNVPLLVSSSSAAKTLDIAFCLYESAKTYKPVKTGL